MGYLGKGHRHRSQATVLFYLLLFPLLIICSACTGNQQSDSISGPGKIATPTSGRQETQAPSSASYQSIAVHPQQLPASQTDTPTQTQDKKPALTATPIAIATIATQPTQSAIPSGAMTSQEAQLAQQLFTRINQDRANAGLTPLVWNTILAGTAYQHSTLMVNGCGISHQCPGEAAPCQRIAAAGLNDSACGENIGNAAATPTLWAGIAQIDTDMLNEPEPALHRRNILSTTHHSLGIGIRISSTNQTWITEDFSNL